MNSENAVKTEQFSGNTKVLALTGTLTGPDIEEALRKLAMMISSARHIIIDCQEVQEVDDKGLKFLCSAIRHILSRDRSVEIRGLKQEIVQSVRVQSGRLASYLSCNHSNSHQCIWKM